MPSPSLTPSQRVLRARLAAQTRWSRDDPKEGTRKARETFLASFVTKVDPEGVLPVEERLRRAESLRSAHFTRMALQSARVRGRRS